MEVLKPVLDNEKAGVVGLLLLSVALLLFLAGAFFSTSELPFVTTPLSSVTESFVVASLVVVSFFSVSIAFLGVDVAFLAVVLLSLLSFAEFPLA